MKSPTYAEISSNYQLWQEYADPSGLDTEQAFNEMTDEEKLRFMVECFGPEQTAQTHC